MCVGGGGAGPSVLGWGPQQHPFLVSDWEALAGALSNQEGNCSCYLIGW